MSISGTDYTPPHANALDAAWLNLERELAVVEDIYDRAMLKKAVMARNQFFWDVNKRMGRFMMNGLLLSAGYPAINVPAKRQLEFNQLMLDYYTSADGAAMRQFLRSCLDQRLVGNFQPRKPG